MEEKENLRYEERMKKRKSILKKTDEIKIELEKINSKISNLEEELKNSKIEKVKLENEIKNLKEEYIEIGIPVPEDGDFEISNGLLGGKRDLNLKLIKDLDDKEITQVFQFHFLFRN
jgi:predicted nuclease with TOPRIM domain